MGSVTQPVKRAGMCSVAPQVKSIYDLDITVWCLWETIDIY